MWPTYCVFQVHNCIQSAEIPIKLAIKLAIKLGWGSYVIHTISDIQGSLKRM